MFEMEAVWPGHRSILEIAGVQKFKQPHHTNIASKF